MSTGVLTLALVVAAAGPPGPQKGDAATFRGTVVENDYRPGRQLHREHELTVRILVLDQQDNWSDAAVLTRLRRIEDAVGTLARPVTGVGPDKNAPAFVRLDLVRIHRDGTVHALQPLGPRLRLDADTPASALRPIPLDSFAESELGVFPPRIPHSAAPGEPWSIAAGGNRPEEIWQARRLEFINAEQCQLLVMNQQTEDWRKPVSGKLSWRRVEEVWLSTVDGATRKVHRTIEHREGDSALTTALKIETTFELKEHEKLSGVAYDRARQDVELAVLSQIEAPNLIRDARRQGPRILEAKLAKLDAYLDENKPGSSFQEAIVAVKRTLQAACKGEVAPTLLRPQSPAPVKAIWPEPGQAATNIRAGTTQLTEQRGRPVVLVFFKPGGKTTDLSLAIADALDRRYGGGVRVLPLATFGETAAAIKDRDRLKLTIPVYDGSTAAAAYGVESVPRFAVVDPDGLIRWTFTGVGPETGYLVREQVDRLAHATLPVAPSGKTPSPGATIPRPMPRP